MFFFATDLCMFLADFTDLRWGNHPTEEKRIVCDFLFFQTHPNANKIGHLNQSVNNAIVPCSSNVSIIFRQRSISWRNELGRALITTNWGKQLQNLFLQSKVGRLGPVDSGGHCLLELLIFFHISILCSSAVLRLQTEGRDIDFFQRCILLRSSATTNWGFTWLRKNDCSKKLFSLKLTITKGSDLWNRCLPFITPGPKPCRIKMMKKCLQPPLLSHCYNCREQILNWSLRPTFFATASELEGGIGFMTRLINPLNQSHPIYSAKSGKNALFDLCFLQGIQSCYGKTL